MTTMTELPWSRPLTRADLDAVPEDGRRHELVEGSLLLSPVAGVAHQRVLGALAFLLHAACPADLHLVLGPVDVVLGPHTVLRPDLVVARRADFTERDLPEVPLLAVEVLSPYTRQLDLKLRFALFEAAGCASYWVVDPDTPELVGWEMRDGAYVQVAKAAGDERAEFTAPFEVSVVPADLTL